MAADEEAAMRRVEEERLKQLKKEALGRMCTIIKKLNNKLETWTYEKLDEADRIALEIKRKIN